jgi:CheY-like chemotaxis protein
MLLVDDDPQVLTYMQEALEEAGYSLTATTSGTDALASIKERLPDLLILDLNMPEPDGFDILKTVRSQFPDLKILVISGYLTGVLLDAATVVGAIATIEKPFSSEALVAKVREVFGE